MSVATEEKRIREMLGGIELIESVSRDLPLVDKRRSQLEEAVRKLLTQVEPIRVEIAARLLGVSDKTIRAWTKAGLLFAAQGKPRLLLDPVRLHEVARLADDLRAAGKKNRELLDLIWYRLSDEALLEDADLMESLAQMARGEYAPLDFDQLGPSTKDM